MNNAQVNVLDALQMESIKVLNAYPTWRYIAQMWTNEGVQNLTDEEIQSLATFAGVTATEALAAKTAFDNVLTALGDPLTPGTNSYKMLKLANNIP